MPTAFDLEDLVEIGREKEACPYYGARAMAKTAHIVFCPYNYLIDPSIRSNVSSNLFLYPKNPAGVATFVVISIHMHL